MTLEFHMMARATRVPEPAADAVLTKAVLNAAVRLDLPQKHLATVLGASEASISRLQRGRTITPKSKEGELAILFLRVYRGLDTLVGGNDGLAREWLHAPNQHLGGVPAERLTDVQGLVDVVQYLDAMRGRL
jgi:hypothetical protein